MKIRNAEEKDAKKIMLLLSQVLEIHADIRPDIFIHGTTKYSESQIFSILQDESRRTYVAADENDCVLGYAFCELKEQPQSDNLIPFKYLYIDDLCIDRESRGKNIGKALFEFVKIEAKKLGCYEIVLNVWEGNDSARGFYDKMGMKIKKTEMEYIL